MEKDSKIFFALTRTTGGKYFALPWTMGGDTQRRPGQRVVTLQVAPDNGYTPRCPGQWALSFRVNLVSAESIKLKITPHCVKKVF